MVQFSGDVRQKVLLQLFILLGHPFPVVSVSTPPQGHLKVCAHVRPLDECVLV